MPAVHREHLNGTVKQHEDTQSCGAVGAVARTTNGQSGLTTDWVVQKFGGTSLGKFAVTIAEDIVLAGLKDHKTAVVCSARSTNTKSEGTTSRLLRAAGDALAVDSLKYIDIVEDLRRDHQAVGHNTISDQGILEHYIGLVNRECHVLLRILESARYLKAVTNQTKDMIISVGEKLSCLLMTAILQTKGVNAVYVDLGEIISLSSIAATLDDDFYKDLADVIGARILALGPDVVPVVTGFFGKVPGGLLEQVGRGYTDLCAALTAVGLQARELQIWKEVDGVFTADPEKVPTARLLKTVTPAEAAELTFYGSAVIHPFTMDQVIRANIPIRIKNVVNPRSSGTVICPDPADSLLAKQPGLFRNRSSSYVFNPEPTRPTAVTTKPRITVLNVHSKKRTRAHGFLATTFSILDQNGLSVDLISSSEVHISMAIHSENALIAAYRGEDDLRIQSEALQRAVDGLRALGDVDLVPDLAIISLVGRQLRGMRGISGHFFSTLGDHGINIEMISQGASEISIGCVVAEREATRALNIVHTNLFTFLE